MSSHVSLLTFKFDNFERLPHDNRSETWLNDVTDANNNKWSACLYPGGYSDESALTVEGKGPLVEVDLCNDGGSNLDFQCSFIIRNKKGSIVREILDRGMIDDQQIIGGDVMAMTRVEVLDEANGILVDGSFHVECLIQVKHKVDFEGKGHFYLPLAIATDVVDILTNQCVVSFSIGKKVFRLHKHILRERAPILGNICEGGTKDKPILLTNVTSEVFSVIIRYIYRGELPNLVLDEELLKETIHAADYYGVEDLKMVVETTLVANRVIHISSVVDWLLLADTKTCPLLKEYAMAYITARPGDVLKTERYAMLSSELKDEIILFMHRTHKPSGDNSISSFAVDKLLRKLSQKGLDVYGSKETLISRLEESDKRKRDDE